MQCAEARALIDAGVRPGPGPGRAALADHLAGCADCRGQRAAADEALLAGLLRADEALLAGMLSAGIEPPRRPARHRLPAWLRHGALAAAALLALWLGLTAGRMAFAAYTISRNLAAMQVAPTPALRLPGAAGPSSAPTAPPTAAPPTAAPPAAPTAGLSAAAADQPSPAPAAGQPAPIGAEAPDPPAAAPSAPAAFQPSPTPIRLPALGGQPIPTLMATAPVALPSGEAVNILVLGSDRRPGEGWATRSDAVLLVRLEPARQRVALLSLPRDLIVPIPGYGQARVNAATVYGENDPAVGGAELARQTVSQYLGLPIDHVVRLDFNAFTAAVDAIGGVDVYVEEELYDGQYPTMDYGYQEVYFAPGMQRMDGETALIYSRVRHMDSNYARNRRQQQVILAIVDKVRQENLLGQVELISDLSTALRDHVQTDLSLEQMLGLAWQFRGLLPQQVERYALDESMVTEGVLSGDPYATFALPGAVDALVGRFLAGGGE